MTRKISQAAASAYNPLNLQRLSLAANRFARAGGDKIKSATGKNYLRRAF